MHGAEKSANRLRSQPRPGSAGRLSTDRDDPLAGPLVRRSGSNHDASPPAPSRRPAPRAGAAASRAPPPGVRRQRTRGPASARASWSACAAGAYLDGDTWSRLDAAGRVRRPGPGGRGQRPRAGGRLPRLRSPGVRRTAVGPRPVRGAPHPPRCSRGAGGSRRPPALRHDRAGRRREPARPRGDAPDPPRPGAHHRRLRRERTLRRQRPAPPRADDDGRAADSGWSACSTGRDRSRPTRAEPRSAGDRVRRRDPHLPPVPTLRAPDADAAVRDPRRRRAG